MNIYDFKVNDIDGNEVSLSEYKGKVMLIVNTASKCGFTNQYEGLQRLYDKYKDRGFVVLGFPSDQFNQEPDEEATIKSFCAVNFGVSFPMFSKVKINGEDEEPLFTFLKEKQNGMIKSNIKWNFTKFLVDREGNVVSRFAPTFKPENIELYVSSLVGD
ncbi:MAG: glutathione peroxidase [Tissierellia bacterium]|nr:glutathione peroxidase [Tissierellia bacterium]